MTFTRLNDDICTYSHNLKQSLGVGDYMTSAPRVECKACFHVDPRTRIGSGHVGGTGGEYGASTCEGKYLIDVNSELLNITRKASNCPTDKYSKDKYKTCDRNNLPDCKPLTSEDTRMSNPPCTLRCTGWNRWQWLCQNPQDKAIVGFQTNINNRIVVKDNHRPCIPNPLNQINSLPPLSNGTVDVSYTPSNENIHHIPSIHWRKLDEYSAYI